MYVVIPSKAKDFYSEIGDDKLLLVFQDPNKKKEEAVESNRVPEEAPRPEMTNSSDLDPRLRRTIS